MRIYFYSYKTLIKFPTGRFCPNFCMCYKQLSYKNKKTHQKISLTEVKSMNTQNYYQSH